MAKDNFLLKKAQGTVFKELSHEDAGKLIKGIFDYVNTGESNLESYLKVIFIPIKEDIDKNEEKYMKICEINKSNGSKGGAPRGNRNAQKEKTTEINRTVEKTTENNMTRHNHNHIHISNINNQENINNNLIKNKLNNKFIRPTLEELKEYCDKSSLSVDCQYFYDYYESNGWLVGKNKMKDWKATLRNWNRRNKKDNSKLEEWKDLKKEQMTESETSEMQEILKKYK